MRWFLPSSSEIERALKSTTTREVGGLNNHKKTPPQPQCLKIAQKCLILVGFQKLAKIDRFGIFNQLLSTQM